jgi:hypothetical protein
MTTDQYTATLECLQETNDENFKNYMTRKTQGWFRHWGCAGTSDAVASPAPGAAPPAPGAAPPATGGVGNGAAATTPARETAPEPSDDEGPGTASLITLDQEGGTADNNRGPSPT